MMESMSQDEDLISESNNNFNPDELTTPGVVVDQLKTIAETGTVDIDWPDLQRALKLRLKNVLDHYIERNRDCKEDQNQEPNVEKFNLENSRDEILELIDSFNEAPFTIQRICELLYSPFKYYDRVSTFLRALEKTLRVISSNNWPKSQIETSRTNMNSSNNQSATSQQHQQLHHSHNQESNESQENIQPNIQIDEDSDVQTEFASDNNDISKTTDQVVLYKDAPCDDNIIEPKTGNDLDQVEGIKDVQEEGRVNEQEKQSETHEQLDTDGLKEEVCVQADDIQ